MYRYLVCFEEYLGNILKQLVVRDATSMLAEVFVLKIHVDPRCE